MKVRIYRYLPEQDAAPRLQDYTYDLQPGEDMMVLDLLEHLKTQDQTLTYRRSCREGVCGSDGMNINGANCLACITSVSTLLHGGQLPSGQAIRPLRGEVDIVIRPLPGLPVIRDLVVDMRTFYRQYERIKPYLINDQPPPAIERLQSPEERARLDGLYECILCACCSTQCPSWWWNPERFIGPAGLLNAYRFLVDSRDTATEARLAALDDPFSVFRCRSIYNCIAFCPKKLKPRAAIGHIERMLLKRGT
ncbi:MULTISPECIES: succinate dehydrogenase iron-sulfur subunit [Pseudomonas]|jgi:succinate dehydrogenase / fumarate reductase iron-sulfur subunit|uniref:succinate dehydrogenase iron-sulfur subunit n=1 Tax=Pseudomonas TaxID=286 RepID=UPI00071876ED|nr:MULTISPECIES: succinate dehydrogenase iron-sulfur subunit [Pseudomonas]AMO76197.1 Succinate dehydrogenase iron-sulfur subunit [Pseudomonas citronellolis]KRV64434.1 succinate dehydrogenase [Pseudomonas citronellolis]KRW76538.1 succinate dehydrogenase [Pseudomonas citronellolis]WAB90663.1 succinate dehydrogenase iron-sulfur subunit [Pseudomonas citronellolis]GLU39944.1 succinate dehydrogenase iron-sulfur subunit [Pseudomonas sp. NBRC 100443]